MRRLLISTVFLIVSSVAVASAQDAPTVDDPEVLAELAVQRQPGLAALRSRVEALRDVASVARLWTDPMAGLEFSNLPVIAPWIDQHPMAGIQLKLQQTFPAPGQTRTRGLAAEARADAAEEDIEALANSLRGEVRSRYWDLALMRQLRDITRDHVTQLDGLIEAVDLRYRVGSAEQHDRLQLQLHRDQLQETVPDLEAKAEVVQAALNGALARDPATPIGTPKVSTVDGLPGTREERVAALERHPDLKVLRARAKAERAEADRARAESLPELTGWLGYRIRAPQSNGDPGTNLASVGISLPIPAASTRKWTAMAQAAQARARAAEEAADSRAARLTAALAAAEAKQRRAADRAEAYRTSLEATAQATLESTRSAYEVDRAGFADLIRADIDLLDVQVQRVRAEAEAAAARAQILTLLAATAPDGASR